METNLESTENEEIKVFPKWDDFDLDDDEPEEEDGILAELRKARQGYGDDEEDY